MKFKDIMNRALKTFWEAALGYAAVNAGAIALNLSDIDITCNTVICLIASALAAGLSAVWNGILAPRFACGTPVGCNDDTAVKSDAAAGSMVSDEAPVNDNKSGEARSSVSGGDESDVKIYENGKNAVK